MGCSRLYFLMSQIETQKIERFITERWDITLGTDDSGFQFTQRVGYYSRTSLSPTARV